MTLPKERPDYDVWRSALVRMVNHSQTCEECSKKLLRVHDHSEEVEDEEEEEKEEEAAAERAR